MLLFIVLPGIVLSLFFAIIERKLELSGLDRTIPVFSVENLMGIIFAVFMITLALAFFQLSTGFLTVDDIATLIFATPVIMIAINAPMAWVMRKLMPASTANT